SGLASRTLRYALSACSACLTSGTTRSFLPFPCRTVISRLAKSMSVSFKGIHLRRDTVIPQWFQASKAAAASDGHAVHCWVTAVICQLSRSKRIPPHGAHVRVVKLTSAVAVLYETADEAKRHTPVPD